jgi:hypothetical protein
MIDCPRLPRSLAAGLLFFLALAPCEAGVVLTPVDPAALDTSALSVNGDTTAAIKFVNELCVPVDIYWIDYSGNRVFYRRLPAGASYLQLTFRTHPWIVVEVGSGGTTAQGTGVLLAGFLPETSTPWFADFDTAFIRAPATPATLETVMSGLDNPRGLGFGPDDALYVTEAGKGGPPAADASNCRFVRGQVQCVGATAAVSRLRSGTQERVATGLPSYAPQPSGRGATGAHDIALRGQSGWITVGLGGDPRTRHEWPGDQFGRLVRMRSNGTWSAGADIAAHEAAHNPDGNVPDSNPYGIQARHGGLVVTDAGGNDLLKIDADGDISTLAVFPARPGRPTDSVPTAVVRGRDDTYYVSELTGVPFATGAANIYRVRPHKAPEVFLSGFTAVIDLAVACDGRSLYVLQHATGPGLTGPGALIRVAPDGTRTTVNTDLTAPTSVAVDCEVGDGDDDEGITADHNGGNDHRDDDHENAREVIYVSNRGTSACTGEVVRVR